MAGLLSGFVNTDGKDAYMALSVKAVFGDLALSKSIFTAQVQDALTSLRIRDVRRTMERTLSLASGNATSMDA